ncbi:copper resistance protein CopD [Bermanella sp. R86510]|uniref:copper resistance protein CopD n=1 Tax=unclassified Bermanella TaxID=2627862 RepID=UPI0037CA0270
MYSFLLILHILGATVWTGGHIVLALAILPYVLRNKDVNFLKIFESLYEKVGIPSLVMQVVTGFMLTAYYISYDFSLITQSTALHTLFLTKFGLLALIILFAFHARVRIIPNLHEHNLIALALHIIPVTIISILFVLAGAGFKLGWFS